MASATSALVQGAVGQNHGHSIVADVRPPGAHVQWLQGAREVDNFYGSQNGV